MKNTDIKLGVPHERYQQFMQQRHDEGFETDEAYALHIIGYYLDTKSKRLLAEYWDDLKKHDWYFNMTDDRGVWRRGDSNQRRLRAIASVQGPEFTDMYQAFVDYHQRNMKGEATAPLPNRPNF